MSLRAELAALGLSSLQRRASGSRAQVQAIDSALDSSSPKEALISLIVSVELDGIERAEEGVPPTDDADDDDEDDEHPPSADDALAALAERLTTTPPRASSSARAGQAAIPPPQALRASETCRWPRWSRAFSAPACPCLCASIGRG